MTDVLVAAQLAFRSTAIALALIFAGAMVGRRRKPTTQLETSALEYRTLKNIVLMAVLYFAADLVCSSLFWHVSWDEQLVLALRALNIPILLVGVAGACREARLAEPLSRFVNPAKQAPPDRGKRAESLWLLAGFAAVLGTLLFLEHKTQFYFTHDDNLSMFLPEILQGCRSLFHGSFPTWNPYQYLGSPTTSLNWYGLTYPPTYFCYWFAKTVLGNQNATLEVFAFFHLILVYAVVYWAIRREGCRPALAMMGSSCCTLSGYALIFSRSWYQFSASLLWMALLVVCVQALVRGNSGWKWILAFGGAVGISFHFSHIQMWMYNVMLADFAIVLLICARQLPRRAIWATISAHFVGLAIAAPLLVPQIITMKGVLRRYPESHGIAVGVINFFVPASIKDCHNPAFIIQPRLIGEMYYSGTLFMLFAVVLLLAFIGLKWTRHTVRNNVWFVCALAAFILALGSGSFAWNFLMLLPGFNGFRYPVKFLEYLVLFVPLAGAVALERVMQARHWSHRAEISLGVVLWLVLAYHSHLCTAAFYSYGFKPFPKPDPVLASKLLPVGDTWYPKVLPISGGIPVLEKIHDWFFAGGYRSSDPNFFNSYMNQWPTVVGVFSIDGYNPLVSESPPVRRLSGLVRPDPERAFYEIGVQYLLEYNNPRKVGAPPLHRYPGAKVVYRAPGIVLKELPKPRPMAFSLAAPEIPLPVKFDTQGATINTSSLPAGGSVVLNMLWRPEFRGLAGGRTLSVSADEWQRIRVQVPPHSNEVRLTFHPHWEWGFAVGFLALAGAVLTAWPSLTTEKRELPLLAAAASG
jgi:hypothetical protein